jgi:hypothetical protein
MTPPREALAELTPAVRRARDLDPRSLVRVRVADGVATALIRLPFGVLVARSIQLDTSAPDTDTTSAAADLLSWLDGEHDAPPDALDMWWRWGTPPSSGWHRVETVPDTKIRPLVRAGALTLKQAAEREGVPGAQPRAEVADALLDSVVLTATAPDERTAEVTLRTLSALIRMGFVPRGSSVHVDVAARWTRVVGTHGTVFIERGDLEMPGSL